MRLYAGFWRIRENFLSSFFFPLRLSDTHARGAFRGSQSAHLGTERNLILDPPTEFVVLDTCLGSLVHPISSARIKSSATIPLCTLEQLACGRSHKFGPGHSRGRHKVKQMPKSKEGSSGSLLADILWPIMRMSR